MQTHAESANFGVGSSNHFPFRAWTDKYANSRDTTECRIHATASCCHTHNTHARTHTHTHTHTHTTILWLSGFCLGQTGGASTIRNIYPLIPIVVISHPLSASSIYYDPRHPPCSMYVTVFFHKFSLLSSVDKN